MTEPSAGRAAQRPPQEPPLDIRAPISDRGDNRGRRDRVTYFDYSRACSSVRWWRLLWPSSGVLRRAGIGRHPRHSGGYPHPSLRVRRTRRTRHSPPLTHRCRDCQPVGLRCQSRGIGCGAHRRIARRSIPSSGQNPKILGRDDTEVIRYMITIGIPFSGHLLAQKGQYCGFEIGECLMTSIMGDVLVHQAP